MRENEDVEINSMTSDLTIEKTPEEILAWTRTELELARSANAFICEMAAKFAQREAKLREALELKMQPFSSTDRDEYIDDVCKKALRCE